MSAALERPVTAADLECPNRPGRRHLFVPRQSKRMVCAYCERTEKQIAAAVPMLHVGYPCSCHLCLALPPEDDRRCASCHLGMSAHPRRAS